MADDPHYNPNQPRVPKGQAHGGEWTRSGTEGIRNASEPPLGDPEPTLADLGELRVASAGGAVSALRMLVAAAIRAEAQRAAAALALREAARSRQFGDPSTSLGEVPPYSRNEVPRGIAADQAVLERFALFDALSARNNAEQIAVIEFKAGEYERLGDLSVTYVGMISREKAEQLCPDLPTVQGALDAAVLSVESEGKLRRSLEPTKYGMEVHARTAATINARGDENLRAEVYWRDGIEGESGLGSVKSDTQATPPNSKARWDSWRPQAGSTAIQQVENLRYDFVHSLDDRARLPGFLIALRLGLPGRGRGARPARTDQPARLPG